MTRRIAVVDVGTNTALLLVAEADGGHLVPVRDERRFVRLGEGVDGTRRVTEGALERLARVLAEYAALAAGEGARMACVAGTSASRDAGNAERLQEVSLEACGIGYEILDGRSEAVLAFAGTMSALGEAGPEATMVDIGGGSTELVRGRTGDRVDIAAAASADVGSVRLTERFFPTLPPPEEAVGRASAWVDERLTAAAAAVGPAPVLVGAAGTCVTLAGLHHGGEPSRDAWPAIDRKSVIAWRERLLGMTAQEVLDLDPDLLFGRADVFGGGVLILDRVMVALRARRLVVSPRGLRHGLALREFGLLEA
jgi:exopolyphosphatase/guanosine-5'-triphosphate,3'-diphosphate pyrophosphatase